VDGLALTFDDGPDPVWTPRLLDLLDRHDVSATFFPIARRAAGAPAVIERIVASGHTIGLHCDEHVRHSHRDRAWVERDTDRALVRLAALGVHPGLWRTPWGDTAPFTQSVARERGLCLVGWTVDTHDWRGDTPEQMLVEAQHGLTAPAIVLAHDGIGPGARRANCEATIRLVSMLVEHARRSGCKLTALS
jgi:peptidoglycan/xylan/chitin deacetylase (PgdA/CDA1 family)